MGSGTERPRLTRAHHPPQQAGKPLDAGTRFAGDRWVIALVKINEGGKRAVGNPLCGFFNLLPDPVGEPFPLRADPSGITARGTGAALPAMEPSTWLPCATTRAAAHPPGSASLPRRQAGLCPPRFISCTQHSPPGRLRVPCGGFASSRDVLRAPSSLGLNKPAAVAQCPAPCRKWERISSWQRGGGSCSQRGLVGFSSPIGASVPHLVTSPRWKQGLKLLWVMVPIVWLNSVRDGMA